MDDRRSLEEKIAALPKGYLSRKKINGKERFYLQWREGGKVRSKYVPGNKVEETRLLLEERKALEEALSSLPEDRPLLPLGNHARALTGDLMSGDEPAASFKDGRLLWKSPLAPLFFLRSDDLAAWLSSRAIDQHRAHSRILKKALRIAPRDDLAASLAVHGATLTDDYWFRPLCSRKRYEDILFRTDRYAEMAFSGDAGMLAKPPSRTPELTLGGSFEKCWRLSEGRWRMEKAGTGEELFAEWFCARIAPSFGVRSATYEARPSSVISPNFADEANFEPVSSLTGDDDSFQTVFRALIPFGENVLEEYLLLMRFDAVVGNVDRHSENMGLLRERGTGKVLGMAPSFDCNLALFSRGAPPSPQREKDGLIRMFRKFLREDRDALRLFSSLPPIAFSRERMEEALQTNIYPFPGEDFLFEYLEGGIERLLDPIA